MPISRFLKTAITICVTLGFATAAHAEKVPLARDGVMNSAVYNGQQNMPVKVYGVARKWERNCIKGKAKECVRLGDAFATGLGDLKQSTRVAAGYYLKGCDKGSSAACATYAGLALGGSLPLPKPDAAVTSATRGCQLGSQSACAWQGVLYHRGYGVAKDAGRAEQLWRTACSANADDGCRFLANYLKESGNRAGQPSQEAQTLFSTYCTSDARPWACLGAAQMLGVERPQAVPLLQRGCEQGKGDRLAVCAEYAARIITRREAKSVDLAEGFLNSACTAGLAQSCYTIGRHGFSANAKLGDVTPGEAGFYLRRGCDLDHAAACHDLADAYISNRMRQVRYPAATMLMLKSCRLGYAPACQWTKKNQAQGERTAIVQRWIDPSLPAAAQLEQAVKIADSNPQKAARTVDLLQEEQYDEAQWLLGNWFLTGKRRIIDTPNQRNAVILIENAAKVGHVEAAKWMGMAHWYGRNGVAFDRQMGLGYMRIAARFGDLEATQIAQSMELQPERDRIAARNRAVAQAEAERQQRSWFTKWLESASYSYPTRTRTGRSASERAAAASWQRHQNSMDRLHFNQRMNYLSGRTSACNRSNPYC
ncbi:tetratricopeptide repeat protein [Alterisphingorhabdus coralli]|uniref:Beta-lactamase n=1 Tax=Alterisphingorhabdus coralli TaxID=3071408 RepID=A0AA97F832_9SPHN|nr:hypothetical protein [Parasphingorhabdus sp. SCSIO 66989]WOE74787.1 hypothetical protein RB602_13210 [Parasphingorhabdus sp. SCSIO 66989]